MFSSTFKTLLAACFMVVTVNAAATSTACTGTISSLSDVSAAVKCTTVNINAFTVPAGETFDLSLLAGTTVNMRTFFTKFLHTYSTITYTVLDRGRCYLWEQDVGGSSLPSQVITFPRLVIFAKVFSYEFFFVAERASHVGWLSTFCLGN